MKSFTLKIITPEKVFFDGETDQIIVRTTEGDIEYLPVMKAMWLIFLPDLLKLK